MIGTGLGTTAWAQSGYHIGEGAQPAQVGNQPDQVPPDGTESAGTEATGPVRMARVSFAQGSVTWRPDGETDWTAATLNTPMRQGTQVWVGDGGRAELQFDDGSVIRLGSGAVVTLQTLFSDAQGEFTEIKMTDGLASMDLRTDHSIYQIDTPHGSVKSVGPSMFRIGVDDDVEIGIREGSATLDGPQGKLTMHTGDYVDVKDDATPYAVHPLPEEDSWDKFIDERHALMTKVDTNLPQNMQPVAGDLDQYGTWKQDDQYGKVWAPSEPTDWQPYYDGQWTWCEPFGWTWVGVEPWGWVPYHYGSWIHRRWGWGWVPGPVCQYWSPAVVSFSYVGGNVCWAPLAPAECVYPAAFGVGVFGPSWGLWFSIGGCGVWYPHGPGSCWSRPWGSYYVNHWHGGFGDRFGGGGSWNHFGGPDRALGGAAWSNVHFTPANARFGAAQASVSSFAGRGGFSRINGAEAEGAFAHGREVGAAAGREPVSGPAQVARPGAASWSPTRTTTMQPAEHTGILNRPTYRGSSVYGGFSRPSDFGERGSSAASAAAAARQSLGWNSRGSSGSGGFGGAGRGFGGGESRGFSEPNRGFGGGSQTRHGSWGVADHGGWTHVHSDVHSSGGGGRSGGGGGGGRSGGGGGGRRGG